MAAAQLSSPTPPILPSPIHRQFLPQTLCNALHRRFHHPHTPLCPRWRPYNVSFLRPNLILIKMGSCTSRKMVGRNSRNNGRPKQPQQRLRRLITSAARSRSPRLFRPMGSSRKRTPTCTPPSQSRGATSSQTSLLPSPQPRNPTTSPIPTFSKRQSQSPKPSSSNICFVACIRGYGATRPKRPEAEAASTVHYTALVTRGEFEAPTYIPTYASQVWGHARIDVGAIRRCGMRRAVSLRLARARTLSRSSSPRAPRREGAHIRMSLTR